MKKLETSKSELKRQDRLMMFWTPSLRVYSQRTHRIPVQGGLTRAAALVAGPFASARIGCGLKWARPSRSEIAT